MTHEVNIANLIDIVDLVENEDGSMTLRVDMTSEALKAFASIGLLNTLVEKAKEVTDGHSDAEGQGDSQAGKGSNPPVHGEFPGF